jgi:hypothetical protein
MLAGGFGEYCSRTQEKVKIFRASYRVAQEPGARLALA